MGRVLEGAEVQKRAAAPLKTAAPKRRPYCTGAIALATAFSKKLDLKKVGQTSPPLLAKR